MNRLFLSLPPKPLRKVDHSTSNLVEIWGLETYVTGRTQSRLKWRQKERREIFAKKLQLEIRDQKFLSSPRDGWGRAWTKKNQLSIFLTRVPLATCRRIMKEETDPTPPHNHASSNNRSHSFLIFSGPDHQHCRWADLCNIAKPHLIISHLSF